MFRLKATLVANSAARSWRVGWSVDRGVDFGLPPAALPVDVEGPVERDCAAPAERPCFIDEDWIDPAAVATRAPPGEPEAAATERAGLRAWSALGGKLSRA